MSTLLKSVKSYRAYIMQIDYALILSAGFGSRMGEIGKRLPKALWPIFSKHLIELQVDYCHDIGIRRIFINTHFLFEEIENFLLSNKKFEDVIILHEDPLLDTGGAIHNMASRGDVNYMGNTLLVNVDQFLFFDNEYFQSALLALENSRAALFGIKVEKDSKYNETFLVNGHLKEIRKAEGLSDYITYSGLGILKLDLLAPVGGPTKFFETVANYKSERIEFIIPEKFEYWDFGTFEIYFKNIKNIYQDIENGKKSLLIEFLNKHGALKGEESNFFNLELNSINLDGSGTFERNSIVGLGLVQTIIG